MPFQPRQGLPEVPDLDLNVLPPVLPQRRANVSVTKKVGFVDGIFKLSWWFLGQEGFGKWEDIGFKGEMV